MSEKIKLELDPKVPTLDLGALPTVSPVSAPLDTVTLKEELAQPETAAHYMEDVNLTEEEQKMVDDFAAQIDLSNTNVVLPEPDTPVMTVSPAAISR